MRRGVRVCLTASAVLEGPGDDGKSPTEEDSSFAFSSGVISAIVPTGSLSSRKSIHGCTRVRDSSRERSSVVPQSRGRPSLHETRVPTRSKLLVLD